MRRKPMGGGGGGDGWRRKTLSGSVAEWQSQ